MDKLGEYEMIELKVTEELLNKAEKEVEEGQINPKLHPEAYYLREISKTLKEILREMRKRKV